MLRHLACAGPAGRPVFAWAHCCGPKFLSSCGAEPRKRRKEEQNNIFIVLLILSRQVYQYRFYWSRVNTSKINRVCLLCGFSATETVNRLQQPILLNVFLTMYVELKVSTMSNTFVRPGCFYSLSAQSCFCEERARASFSVHSLNWFHETGRAGPGQ